MTSHSTSNSVLYAGHHPDIISGQHAHAVRKAMEVTAAVPDSTIEVDSHGYGYYNQVYMPPQGDSL